MLPGYQLRRLGKPQTAAFFQCETAFYNPAKRKPNMHWILKHSGIWPIFFLVGTECCRYSGYILTLFKGYSHVNFDFLNNFLHMSKQKILSCPWLGIFHWYHWYPEKSNLPGSISNLPGTPTSMDGSGTQGMLLKISFRNSLNFGGYHNTSPIYLWHPLAHLSNRSEGRNFGV